jgi:hypothetical protein
MSLGSWKCAQEWGGVCRVFGKEITTARCKKICLVFISVMKEAMRMLNDGYIADGIIMGGTR